VAQRYPYMAQCDVRQFFPSIDNELLRRLIALIIASGVGVLSEEDARVYFRSDDLFAACLGRGWQTRELCRTGGHCTLQPKLHAFWLASYSG
jgi:hypothetical protein